MEHRSPPAPAPAGQLPDKLERLGRYRIVRPLSKGGMALVYEARRESLAGVSPRVAIKVILPEFGQSDAFQELFINEARLGASMHHQNLVQIQDFDRDGDRFFLVMEYVEGLTLRRLVTLSSRNGLTVPLGVIAEIGRQACDGLQQAHVATDEHGRHLGLVHRDMKPSNLILNPQGVVKVLDFGISKGRLMHERRGSVKGTWGYMAPEQAHGRDVGPTADVFGLACVLYELASQRPLFEQKPPEELKQLLNDDHAARMATQLDPQFAPLIPVLVRALQRDPEARFPNAAEFGRALSALLPDPITARDEVVRLYQDLDHLDRGKQPPQRPHTQGPSSGTAASIAGSQASLDRGPSPIWVVLGAGFVTVGVVALLAVVVGGATIGYGLMQQNTTVVQDSPVLVTPTRAADEPPGPAGVGAPGEDRPAPIAIRTAPADPPPDPAPLRAPPASSVKTASGSSGADDPQPDVAQPTVVVVQPEAVTVTVSHKPEPPPEPVAAVVQPKPDPKPDPVPRPPPPVGTGKVTISAVGYGAAFEIWIDGKMAKSGAMTNVEYSAGPHTVKVYAADGRVKEFTIDVPADGTVRKIWDFDRGTFR